MSELRQESARQSQPTSPSPIPSQSPPSVSTSPQGAHDHPTPLHSSCHAFLHDGEEIGGLTVHQLRMELDKKKKLKDEAESELAAERLVKEAALREKRPR